MARDIYIKFGETPKDADGISWPEIEGDSSDEEHYFWTEVRDCSFAIEAAERPQKNKDEDSTPSDSEKQSRPTLKDVSISKKVDWGSIDLFRLCCQSPVDLKTNKGIDPKKDEGQLKKVIVEVCRRSGIESEGRYSFLTITFGGVYVIGYKIDFGGPDPMEEITLKYGQLSFSYISADPETGGRMDRYNAYEMDGFPPQSNPSPPAAGGAAAVAGAAGGGGAAAPLAAVTTGASGGGGSAQSAGPAPDAAIVANFPGYMSVAGNGILAD